MDPIAGAPGNLTELRWPHLSREASRSLASQIGVCRFKVDGKSMNKDEFVTCGGVNLDEVNFKTMESRLSEGLYFAGELLDIDGITGGFNFQSAWTTGRIVGEAIAESIQANES
jgi:predicted flavoprotein YhiN